VVSVTSEVLPNASFQNAQVKSARADTGQSAGNDSFATLVDSNTAASKDNRAQDRAQDSAPAPRRSDDTQPASDNRARNNAASDKAARNDSDDRIKQLTDSPHSFGVTNG
jgi:chemotaxis protein MotD